MKTVKIRNLEIGAGIPKICAPIIGRTRNEILTAAGQIKKSGADIAEWRADWYDNVFQFPETIETAGMLRETLGDIPLLFTFRTSREGGEKDIDTDTYVSLNESISKTGYVDLIDAEAFTGDNAVKRIISSAHTYNVKIIVSNHDFHKTPDKDELVSRLIKMQNMGADISKIAVMPQNKKDVLVLLAATEEMAGTYADRPVITMSMGRDGIISRICGEIFGSAVTFGAVGQTSAPGQMDMEDLKTVLSILNKNFSIRN